jgi:hypothetical protein
LPASVALGCISRTGCTASIRHIPFRRRSFHKSSYQHIRRRRFKQAKEAVSLPTLHLQELADRSS